MTILQLIHIKNIIFYRIILTIFIFKYFIMDKYNIANVKQQAIRLIIIFLKKWGG